MARQYCGRLGKVANCQAGMFLAYVSPLGRALVDKRLYLPKSWTSDPERCAAAGVPEARRGYRLKTELALEMLERALQLGHLRAGWVAGDDAFGMSPSFRDGLAALGMRYVLDVPGSTTVWPLEPEWTGPLRQGRGRPRKPRLQEGQRRTLDGSEPRYYLSNAPEDTTLETLAYVGGSRWRIETEFETEKGDVGLDEYETRSWAGWHHHIATCLLGGAFLLSLQQEWGGKMPRTTRPQVYRVVREMLPRGRFGPHELLLWLRESQLGNERAARSHQRRRSARRKAKPEPPP